MHGPKKDTICRHGRLAGLASMVAGSAILAGSFNGTAMAGSFTQSGSGQHPSAPSGHLTLGQAPQGLQASVAQSLASRDGVEQNVPPQQFDGESTGDLFGYAVDIMGASAAVGVPGTGSGGIVYTYFLSGGIWVQRPQVLWDPEMTEGDRFGAALDLTPGLLLVGSPGWDSGTGRAYAYRVDTGGWSAPDTLTSSGLLPGDHFGSSVAGLGNLAMIGAPDRAGTGLVYTFRKIGPNPWTSIGNPLSGGPGYGSSVSYSPNYVPGGYSIVGEPGYDGGIGIAYVYRFISGQWTSGTPLQDPSGGQPGDEFGAAVSISTEQSAVQYAVVGSPGQNASGLAFVFHLSGATWTPEPLPLEGWSGGLQARFGEAVAIAGRHIVVGAPGESPSGGAYEYKFLNATWQPQRKLLVGYSLPGGRVGQSVGISGPSSFGVHTIVGAPQYYNERGRAYIFGEEGFIIWIYDYPASWFPLSQYFEDAYSDFSSSAAANFSVTRKSTIKSVEVAGTYFNGSGPARDETITFYADAHGVPGEPFYRKTVHGTDNNGSFGLLLPTPVKLRPGSYWFSVAANMDYESGGEWGWQSRSRPSGKTAAWRNPYGGWETGCTNWTDIQRCLPGQAGPGLIFALYG